jgi:pimeloyl-ACP methyl ester carboxylesterase
MNFLVFSIALFSAALAGAFAFTLWQGRRIDRRFPNLGIRTEIAGIRINSLHWPRPATADLPALVFIHGASGNLRDPLGAFLEPLGERAEMLFPDRPGHGYSDRGGRENLTPDGQADAIARLMVEKGIARAVIIGHSFGGATAATFALRHPDKTAGLVFLAPATHPWPGGIDWYYRLANLPLIGPLFCYTLVMPAGLVRIRRGVSSVFGPNPVPEGYLDTAAIPMVLRPDHFLNNARDVANLLAHVRAIQPRYREIATPTVIITGDSDAIVYESIHAQGLARDIPGALLFRIANLGHKPDYIATDLAIAAIEHVAGHPRDLQAIADTVEKRIAPAAQTPLRPSEPI